MSAEEAVNSADYFLRQIPDVKSSNSTAKTPAPKPQVKEELQILQLSKKSQACVMETLKFIHGEDFTLEVASSYQDKGSNLSNKFWQGRGNLIIKGYCDFSNVEREPENEIDRFKMFALLRLESYGFHKEHCQEAMEHCEGDIEKSLSLLYEKYFKLKRKDKIEHDYSEKELLEQRIDEKGVLESIYEDAFSEKVLNSVWIINCKLDYLLNLYMNRKPARKETYSNKHLAKRKEKCRHYLRNKTCKYGNNCLYVHEEESKKETDLHLNKFNFEVEVRFPSNTRYPFEPPLIFLRTDAILPHQLNLHIAKRLLVEAENLSTDGMPSIYSVIELLKNEEEMVRYLKTTEINFLGADEKLFPRIIDVDNNNKKPSHYKRGVTKKDNKIELTSREILAEDIRISKRFCEIQYSKGYLNMQRVRRNLPAWSYRNTIINTIKTSSVIVISGETGCGKSTQIPQFILDDWLENFDDNHVEVICTQPRRISAIGVAERVSQERTERVGNVVGYQIRLENKVSLSTRLTFCTTGILLRRLELDPLLSRVTHIIVDEVHERSEESDFLLLILRDLLRIRTDLKVILMSATINADIFSAYFGDVPVVEIPGRTFPVEQYFLEDILEMSDYTFEETSQYARGINFNDHNELTEIIKAGHKPKDLVKDENLKFGEVLNRYDDFSFKTCKNLYLMDPDKINLDLITHVLEWIVNGIHSFPKSGSILIFLPGIAEIMSLYEQLCCHPIFSPKYNKFVLVPLHSSLTSEEQTLVFQTPKNGARKLVLSTNIAETSITIDDCLFVIDSGKMKEKHFDSNRNMESLDTVWASRANALQRKGRAGRVMSGVCIHLYTGHRFKHHMLAQPIPEIKRVPLDQLLLNIKVLPNFSNKSIHDVLNKIIEPPVEESIDSSITRLQNVGAFDREEKLTPLGHHLAALPVDVRIGKLMLFGAIFSCVDSALTMAACLSYKTPFVTPFNKKDIATARKKKFSMGLSDQMTILCAYNKYQEANKKGYLSGANFARENYLSHNTLVTIADIKYQFLELLVSIGFVPIDLGRKPKSGQDLIYSLTGKEFNKYGDNVRVLSSILCAALYPNVVKVLTPEKSFIASSTGAVPKQHEAKDFKFKTKQELVFLHPSSVVYDTKHYSSPFMVYQEKVKTSRIFIRDCCMIPIIPLVLFSGFDVNIKVLNGTTFIVMDDNWIMFQVDEHRIAEMIKMIRTELLTLLEEKIKDPLLNLQHNQKSELIISTILQLVTCD